MKNIIRGIFFMVMLYSTVHKLMAGDDPCSPTILDTDAAGAITIDNSGNSNSSIAPPPYGNYAGPDSWLQFTMPASGTLPMVITPGSMTNPAIAIYSGSCSDPKLIYNVIDDNCDSDLAPAILFDELVPGEDYLIRVWAENGAPNGDFDISFDISISNPIFLTYADAYLLGDGCIQLTDDNFGLHGCAWFENPIDFSVPFTHVMNANFGTLQYNASGYDLGADGICLVYQTNGSNYCGSSGQGIGAEGMPNSVIIEFDTWQNTNLNDPFQDHSSININGDMNHNSSIDGPVTLVDIEDGIDHEIKFSWDPSTNGYIVEFDGGIILNGNYDFINNAFGGQTDVWWGYTSATGGSTNNQVICPVIPNPVVQGTQEYQEVTICEGENYFGYTTSGFYIDYLPGADNCEHQTNLLLEVIPFPEISELDTTICAGESFYFNGTFYYTAGTYSSLLLTDDLCDSTALLYLDIIDLDLTLNTIDTLTCNNTSVEIYSYISTNVNNPNLSYTWTGPGNISSDSLYYATIPGVYQLTVELSTFNHLCSTTEDVIVAIDTLAPFINSFMDDTLSCGDTTIFTYEIFPIAPNVNYQWYDESNVLSNSSIVHLSDIGTYYIEAVDAITGCIAIDSVSIVPTGNIPTLSVVDDTLTCVKTTISLQASSLDQVDYMWYYQGSQISTDQNPIINQSGTYTVEITNSEGCTTKKAVQIDKDTISPISVYKDDTIPCNTSAIDVLAIQADSNNNYSWSGPNNYTSEEININVVDGGIYYLTLTDPVNGCIFIDSVNITGLGDSLLAQLSPQDLNCYNRSYQTNLGVNDPEANYQWSLNNQAYSNSENISIESEGQYQLTITSVYGCESNYSFYIKEDLEAPQVSYLDDTIPCNTNSILVFGMTPESDLQYLWSGPNGFLANQKDLTIVEQGDYFLTITNPINGCTSLDTLNILDYGNSPIAEIYPKDLDCYLPSYNIDLQINDAQASIEWTLDNQFFSAEQNPLITSPGDYHVLVSNSYGCSSTYDIEVKSDMISPDITIDSAQTINCDNPEIDLKASLQNDVQYEWTGPNNYQSQFVNPTVDQEGLYQLNVIDTTNGCTSSYTITVHAEGSIPEFDLEAENMDCTHNTAIVNINTTEVYESIQWSGPNGYFSTETTIEVDLPGEYKVDVVNEYGCIKSQTIYVSDTTFLPQLTLHQSTYIDYKPGNSVQIDAEIIADEENIVSIRWEPSTFLSCSDCLDPIFMSENEENINYKLTIINKQGCQDNIFMFFRYIEPIIPVTIVAPNIFYGDKSTDPSNNRFTLYGTPLDQIDQIQLLSIYDRWGNRVYTNSNFPINDPSYGWDGTFKGEYVDPAVFVYHAEVLLLSGKIIKQIGDVTVAR